MSLDETASERSADDFRLDCQCTIGYRKLCLRIILEVPPIESKEDGGIRGAQAPTRDSGST
jgi:hypothetical protein